MLHQTHFKMADFEKVGGQTFAMRDHPFNLTKAAHFILPALKRVRDNLNGRPLVVLMGEDHRVASHVLLQLIALSEMQGGYKNKPGFAVEMPYNSALPALTHRDGYSHDKAQSMINNDHHGQLSLRSALASDIYLDAPFSRASLLNFCLQTPIRTCFADAASLTEDRKWMDCNDEYVRQYIQKKGYDVVGQMSTGSLLGFEIRNHFMAERALSFIKNADVKTLVMGVGYHHIFGLRNQYLFDTSLASLFHKAGVDFMVVLPFGKHIHLQKLPEESLQFWGRTIGLLGLDEKEFVGSFRKNEIPYIQKTMAASGRETRAPAAAA